MGKNLKEQSADLLIEEVAVVTMNESQDYFSDGYLAIRDGMILKTGPMHEASAWHAREKISMKGCVAIPGFINAHSHIGMSFLRGQADDIRLYDFLDRTFPVLFQSDHEVVYLFALLACAEMLKSGYTTTVDIMEQLPATAAAVSKSGMRGKLSPNIVNFLDDTKTDRLLEENIGYYEKYQNSASGRIQIDFNIHAPYSCSKQLMTKIKQAAQLRKADIHLHLSENLEEVSAIREKYNMTPTEYLDSLGILGPDVLAAHFVQVTDHDIDLARIRGIRVAHNPASNMKLASGFAPVAKLLKAGILVGLGTDSCVTNNRLDAFDTMKWTALIHKGNTQDATVLKASEVLNMAGAKGARAIGLDSIIGTLEDGKRADITFVRMDGKPHCTPWIKERVENTISHLVYSLSPADVDMVMVDGNILVKHGKVIAFDEKLILKDAQKAGEKLLNKTLYAN